MADLQYHRDSYVIATADVWDATMSPGEGMMGRLSSSLYSNDNTANICKLWGVHGGDYEKCRLLGYKNPVRTSQETHYVSTTEHSRLMLCKF
jgi:hypothetical protein